MDIIDRRGMTEQVTLVQSGTERKQSISRSGGP